MIPALLTVLLIPVQAAEPGDSDASESGERPEDTPEESTETETTASESDEEPSPVEESPVEESPVETPSPVAASRPAMTERAQPRVDHRRRRQSIRRDRSGQMQPWGQLQVFATVFDQDEDPQADPATYGDPEADPGFQLARARFGFMGKLPMAAAQRSHVDYALSIGVNTRYDVLEIGTRDVGMVDAFLRYNARPSLGPSSVSLGLAKVPFSREALMSSVDLVFMERAVGPANVTSVRDVGVTVSQAFVLDRDNSDAPQIVFRGGAYNGNADFLGDDDPGLMYAGRLELAKGDTYKTWDPDKVTSYGLGGAVLLDDALTTRTFGWTADGLVRLGPWSLMGEFARATVTPTNSNDAIPDVVAETTRTSWVAATSLWIGTQKRQGVEVSARVSGFDDNARLKDNGDVLILHGGALVRNVLPFFDLGAAYIHREELQGTAVNNDTIRIYTQIRPAR